MSIQTAATNLVTSRLWDVAHAKAGKQRANHHHRATQAATTVVVVVATQVIEIDVGGGEGVAVARELLHLYAHIAQKLNKLNYIENLRYVMHHNTLLCQKCSTQNLQSLILRTLWCHATVESVTSLYLENCHSKNIFLSKIRKYSERAKFSNEIFF